MSQLTDLADQAVAEADTLHDDIHDLEGGDPSAAGACDLEEAAHTAANNLLATVTSIAQITAQKLAECRANNP